MLPHRPLKLELRLCIVVLAAALAGCAQQNRPPMRLGLLSVWTDTPQGRKNWMLHASRMPVGPPPVK